MKKIFILSMLIFHFASPKLWAENVYSLTDQGTKLYKEGKFDKALEKFTAAQVEDSANPKAGYNLGNAYYKNKDYEKAANSFMRTIMTSEDILLKEKAHYNLGNTYFKQGKLNDAAASYENALKIDPKDEDAKKNLEFVKKLIQQHKEQEQRQKDNPDRDKKDQEKQEQKEGNNQQSQKDKQQEGQKSQDSQKKDSKSGEKKDGKIEAAGKQDEQKKDGSGQAHGQMKKLSKEEAKQLLQMINEEKNTFMQQKMMKERGQERQIEKDW